MANLSTLNFTALVRNQVAAIQAGSTALLNLTVGSVLRAITEANAAVILWLQGLVAYVLTLTRAATSVGSDLDTFFADFGFVRLPAASATGLVTFARFTSTAQAVVPFNSKVQSADGTQSFFVTIDPANAAYNLALGGYVLPISTASISVPVKAVNAGTQGNVLANSITSISQGISGVDTVTNSAAFITGIDAESDPAFRLRFVAYLASLFKATGQAIGYAVQSVQQGLQYTITENQNYDGTDHEGYFFLVCDDGSGSPPSGLLDLVRSAVDAVRGLSISFAVFAPTVLNVVPTMVLTSAAGYDHPTVIANVTAALQNAINALPLGTGLPYTRLPSIAYGVPGVTNVAGVLLNGTTADIAGNAKQKLIAGTPVIS